MASISISGWNNSGGRVFTLTVTEGSYNSSTKKSTVNWSLSSSGGGGSWYDAYLYASVNNGQVYNSGKVSWASGSFPATTGSTSGSISVDRSTGEAVTVPFYIEGYCFSYDVRSSSSSITLAAQNYTITYNGNGNTGGIVPGAETVTAGGRYYINQSSPPEKFGYNFEGWSDGTTTYLPTDSFVPSGNTTLTAVWGNPGTLSTTGATSGTANLNIVQKTYFFKVTTTVADDYTFYTDGSKDVWMGLYNSSGTRLTYDDDSGNNLNPQFRYALAANTTYYIGVSYQVDGTTGSETVYMRHTYYLNYSLNGGNSTTPSGHYKMHGINTTVANVTPTRANSTASGYKITFDANGGTCNTASLTATNTLSYTFRCWSTASGSANEYAPGATFSGNTDATFTAQWTTTTTRGSFVLPVPTCAGYIFLGWAESKTATSGVTGTYTPTGTKTLYAIWQYIPTISLVNARYNNQFVTKTLPKIKVNGKWCIATKVKTRNSSGSF